MYLKNQSRKQKKRGVICIAALMLALTFSGCGEKEKNVDTTTVTKENETTTASQEGSSQSDSEFDFSQVYDNIELNGKKIPFPFTLNDLGEEYDFKWDVVDMGDGLYGAQLAYNGESIAVISMLGESVASINRDSKIIEMTFYDNQEQVFSINGINCKSNISDIEKKFINIKSRYNKNQEMCGYIATNNSNLFDISIHDEKITMIIISKEEK